MENFGVLIFFAVLAAFICAKARVPAGAVVFALIALVLFVGTPVGEGLPGAVATFVSVVDDAATPALTNAPAETGAVG